MPRRLVTGLLALLAVFALPTSSRAAVPFGELAAPSLLASDPSLVGAWGFDEASGATVQDASGTGNAGTISGATRTASGRFGGALTFDGVNDWVTVPDAASLRLSGAMTLEAWVYPTAAGGAWRTAIMKERGSDLSYALYATDGANHPAGFVYAGASKDATASSALPVNTWTHLTATYDRTTLRLYVNGAQVATRAATSAITSSTGALRFGGNGVWGEWFTGRIDEVRVYNRALTASEVASDVTRPVSGAVASVTPASLSFANDGDGNPPLPKSIDVSNTGSGTLSFSVSDDAPWLSETPTSGTAPATVRAAVDESGLAPGTYTATITITPSAGSPVTLPVSLTVPPPPRLGAQPASLSFSSTVGGAAPAAKVFDVRNDGGGTLLFTASEDADWMSITPSGGSAPRNVSVTVSPAGLAAGTYTANVTVTAPGVANSPMLVPVTLAVIAPELTLSPGSLTFEGAAPAPQTLAVAAVGGGALSYSISDDAPWLTLDSGGGTTPSAVTASVDTSGLAPGLHTATITATTSGGAPREVPVTLRVPEPPTLTSSPGSLTFETAQGQEATTQNLTIGNAGDGTLDYTVSGDAPWLYLSTDHGTAPGGTVRVGVLQNGLDAGTYTATITVTAPGAVNSPLHVAVTFIVDSTPPKLEIGQGDFLRFWENADGFFMGTLPITLYNSGGGTLDFSVSADVPWLSVSPDSGTAPRSSAFPTKVTATADPSGMAVGTYHASITVTPSYGDPVTVGVEMIVKDPPVLRIYPASLSFAAVQGRPAPDRKSIDVSNDGYGTFRWSASADAPWVSLSQSGTSPFHTLWVSVDPGGLAPGTYTSTITFTATDEGDPVDGSPQTATVTMTVAAQDLTVTPASMSFTTTAGGAAPASKTLTVDSYDMPYTATDDAPWLSLSQSGGTVTASVDPTGLAAGTYDAMITVTAPGVVGSPKTVPVTFVVSPAGAPGLVAAYGFNESSATAVTDASGTGNNGTISGATRTAGGRFGGALSFDGVNDMVTVPAASSLDLTSALTLEAWVYPTASGGLWRTVLMKERTGGLSYALYSNDDGNRPQAFSRTASGELGTRGTATLPLNQWSHLAAIYSGSTMRLYVNGVQVATRSVGAGLTTGTLPLRIGGNAIWGEWFAGRIDEVRVYNRALTASELQTDMNQAVG